MAAFRRWALALGWLLAAGCTEAPDGRKAPLQVVATHSVLCDLTRQVAGPTVALTCLLSAGADPHLHAITPFDRRAVEQADLVLYNGFGLEPFIEELAVAGKPPALAVGEAVLAWPLTIEQEGKTVSDPHLWHDAAHARRMVEIICDRLIALVPERAGVYRQNAAQLGSELLRLDGWVRGQIASIPAARRTLVTTHDALGYYGRAYGLAVVGIVEGGSMGAGRIRAIVKRIQATGVPVIFVESSANPKLVTTVAQASRVGVARGALYADSLGEPGSGAHSYQAMLIANTRTIVTNLGGRYTPFEPAKPQASLAPALSTLRRVLRRRRLQQFLGALKPLPKQADLLVGFLGAQVAPGLQRADITHPLGKFLQIGVKKQPFGTECTVVATARVQKPFEGVAPVGILRLVWHFPSSSTTRVQPA
nr:zinc ABC transporter substrate-binding protein [Gloeobacter violaceus]